MHHNEVQIPKRNLVKRNQTIALFLAFTLTIINALTGRAKGPDLSHWELWYDPDKGTQLSDFAIFKLTEGTSWIDPIVDEIWQGVKKLTVRGGYHYMRSGMSWAAQVNHYLSVASRFDLHFHVVDVEGTGNTYDDTFFADVYRWINSVRDITGQKVLLYTNISTYKEFEASIKRQVANGALWLDNLEFWIAYPSSILTSPPLPAGRTVAVKPWTFWQVSWVEENYGTGAPTDLNVFNGNNDDLLKWAGVSTVPQPEPQPDPNPQPPEETIMHYTATTKEPTKACLSPKGMDKATIPANTFLELDGISTSYNGNWASVFTPGMYSGLWVNRGSLINWKEKPVVVTPPPEPNPQPEPDPEPTPVNEDTITIIMAPGTKIIRQKSDGTRTEEIV